MNAGAAHARWVDEFINQGWEGEKRGSRGTGRRGDSPSDSKRESYKTHLF